jgi:hypothetical protein
MKIGDLIVRKETGEVGVVMKVVQIDFTNYYWVYISSEGREMIFNESLVSPVKSVKL